MIEVGEPNDDEVICPCCAHHFQAVPVNVQDENKRLREAIRMMVRLDKCASPDVYRIAREALGDE